MQDIGNRTALRTIIEHQLATWPEHSRYLEASFADRPPTVLDISDEIAAVVLQLAEHSPHGLTGICEDYRFLCQEIILPEELHFRRNGCYRLASAADAYREVYSNQPLMRRYMSGLLMSNVLWDPHARAIESYVTHYLPSLSDGADHLEIGPGHGLLLYFAASLPSLSTISGWDISPASVAHTQSVLDAMGAAQKVRLQLHNLLHRNTGMSGSFDSITMSELLEHLEDPAAALRAAHDLLRPEGRLWANIPVNSPAPDHIYLLQTTDEACRLVEASGFDVIDQKFFPMTGSSLERARRNQLSISCVITARRAG